MIGIKEDQGHPAGDQEAETGIAVEGHRHEEGDLQNGQEVAPPKRQEKRDHINTGTSHLQVMNMSLQLNTKPCKLLVRFQQSH